MARILGTIASSSFEDLGDFESIATTTVGSGGAANVEFTSIATDWTHLQLRGLFKTTAGGYLSMQVNGTTSGSLYNSHSLNGDGSTAVAYGYTNRNDIVLFSDGTSSAQFNVTVIDILDYKDTNKYKTIRALSGYDANGSGYIYFESGALRSTSAISSLKFIPTLSGSFAQYSTFALYGIRSA